MAVVEGEAGGVPPARRIRDDPLISQVPSDSFRLSANPKALNVCTSFLLVFVRLRPSAAVAAGSLNEVTDPNNRATLFKKLISFSL